MKIIEQLKQKVGAEQSATTQLPEISEAMRKRIENSVAGAAIWCQAAWAQGCS